MRTHLVTAALILSMASFLGVAAAQPPAAPQSFPLTDTKGLVAQGLTMDTADFLGRKAVRLVKTREEGVDGFVPLQASTSRMGRSKPTWR
jgi:hypothetical protein